MGRRPGWLGASGQGMLSDSRHRLWALLADECSRPCGLQPGWLGTAAQGKRPAVGPIRRLVREALWDAGLSGWGLLDLRDWLWVLPED